MAEEKQEQQEQKKEKKQECPAGAPAWMTTYSDLVTLLLTFFVLLLSMASMDPVKFLQASNSMQEAFGIHKQPLHTEFVIPVLPSQPVTPYTPIQQLSIQKVYDKVKSQVDSLRLVNDIGVLKKDDESIILRLNDSILFEQGQARLAPEAYGTLRSIADIVRPLPMDMRIEGHTDDIPFGKSQMGNWDLSVERAVSVLRFYAQSELMPLDRMSSIGYGKQHPIVPNTDETSRAKNRRVDFILRLKSSGIPGQDGKTQSVPM